MRTQSRRLRSLIRWRLALLAFAFVAATLVALPASADPGSVASAQSRAQQVLSQINALDSDLNKAAEAYDAANLRLAQIKRAYVENHRGLLVARKNLRRAQDLLARRLVEMYTSGEQESTLAVVLGSENLDDLLNRIETQNAVARQDERLVSSVTRYAAQAQRRQRQLAHAREDRRR